MYDNSAAGREGRPSKPTRRPAARTSLRGPCCLLTVLLLLLAASPLCALLGYQMTYAERIYPGVTVLDIPLGGLTRNQAEALLNERLAPRSRDTLILRYGERIWPVTREQLGLHYDVPRTVTASLALGRDGPLLDRLREQLRLRQEGSAVAPVIDLDAVQRLGYLNRISLEIDRQAINAAVRVEAGKVSVAPAQGGQRVNIMATAQRLALALLGEGSRQVDLVVEEIAPAVADDAVQEAVSAASAIVASPLVLAFEDRTWTWEGGKATLRTSERTWPLDPLRLSSMLSFRQRIGADGRVKLLAGLDEELVTSFVSAIAPEINQPVREARLERDAKTGKIAPSFTSQEGRTLMITETVRLIVNAATTSQRRLALPVQITRPKVAMEDIAKMGLVELVSKGSSIYKPSSAERTYNIQLAASRIHGAVIPPGETFSFNAALGPVNADTGYREGYSIIGDYTVRDVGGGVCQVATTVFRAAFYGGYEVLERWPHAYVIDRYTLDAPLGLDTTVYDPGVDFKFRNGGTSYLLVQAGVDQAKGVLTVSFYGTNPGWTVSVEGPVMENETPYGPRLPDVADSSLPEGTRILAQPAKNGITSTLKLTVKQGSKVLRTDTFRSRYRPSQEQWIVGTKK